MQISSVTQPENFLPPVHWMNVFSHLSPKDVGVLSSVCRDFSNISRDPLLWETLVRRDYPDTYTQLSERQVVRETEEGNKRRRVDPPTEIDWKKVCIARASFFSATKKNKLNRTLLLKGAVSCFGICGKRIYACGEQKLVVLENKKLVAKVEPRGGSIHSIKVKKRKDGATSIYTGDMKGNITSWQFDGVKLEKKKGFVENSQINDNVYAIKNYRKTLITLNYHQVRIWDKKKGTLLETFKHDVSNDGYSALAISKERIFASTVHGILKIWDANTRELLQEVHDINELNHTIQYIKVRDEKVFYTNKNGIFVYDLIQRSNTAIALENLEISSFSIVDRKLFYFKKMEGVFAQGISIIDLKTLTIEAGPFSSIKTFDSAIKVVPQGILYCHSAFSWTPGNSEPPSGLYITQPGTKN